MLAVACSTCPPVGLSQRENLVVARLHRADKGEGPGPNVQVAATLGTWLQWCSGCKSKSKFFAAETAAGQIEEAGEDEDAESGGNDDDDADEEEQLEEEQE